MSSAQSAVYHIGQLRRGDERHRAVLYKFLADRVSVSASLHRGDSQHTWCGVSLQDGEDLIIDLGMVTTRLLVLPAAADGGGALHPSSSPLASRVKRTFDATSASLNHSRPATSPWLAGANRRLLVSEDIASWVCWKAERHHVHCNCRFAPLPPRVCCREGISHWMNH